MLDVGCMCIQLHHMQKHGQSHTLASSSAGSPMAWKVRSQLMPLRPTAPSSTCSSCCVLLQGKHTQ